MSTPSPDLIRQVEAESVDSPEFRALIIECHFNVTRADKWGPMIANIDSIITARVADLYTEDERREAWKGGYSAGFEAAKGLFSQAAPAKAEGPKLAPGHREDWYLMANARRIAQHPIARIRRMPNWALASELFATGSNSAHQICRDALIDPEGFTVGRAISTPAKEPT